MKKSNLFIFLVLFLIGIIYMYEVHSQFSIQQSLVQSSLIQPLSLLFARTDAERELGLGQRASLPTDEGMLFIFDTSSEYAFWMKDMSFPIDMMWLDADFHIIYIASDVSPSTYPQTFSPPAPSLYVLETNAGYATDNRLTVGQTLDFVKMQVEQSQ